MNNIFIALFHYFLPFSRQLCNSIFIKTFLSFWAKNCSRYVLQSSRELNFFFPLRKFCKDQGKWKPAGAMSGEYGVWIRTSQPNCNGFFLIIKEACILHYPDGRLYVFCWLITGAFQLASLETVLIGINYEFWKELIIEGSLHHIIWMKVGLWYGWWWVISLAPQSPVPLYCKVSAFHHLSQFILKMQHFHYVLVENHMWKWGQEGCFF